MKEKEQLERSGQEPLTFTVEGKRFETFDQYKKGSELKLLADIPLTTHLFLAVVKGYEPELIDNEKEVDLARKDIEHFFVKDKLRFTINGEQFISYEQYITGKKIREIGKIAATDEIFLKVEPPFKNELISDIDKVDLARPGKEHFISKGVPQEIIIIVNGTPKKWNKEMISFKEVIILAFGTYNDNPNATYTVAYEDGPKENKEGSMTKNSEVLVKNKMIFHATATDKS